MNGGDRYNEGKARISMMLEAPEALKGIAEVLEFGAKKYDRGNWKKGLKVTEISDSMLRHLIAFINGEDNDEETGLAHVHHIATNALFLADTFVARPAFDDRAGCRPERSPDIAGGEVEYEMQAPDNLDRMMSATTPPVGPLG